MREHSLDRGIRLKYVLHYRHTFRTVKIRTLARNHIERLIRRLMETGASVDSRRRSRYSLKLCRLRTFSNLLDQILRGHLRSRHIIRCNLAVHFDTINYTVNGNNLNPLRNRILHRRRHRVGIHRIHDQYADIS